MIDEEDKNGITWYMADGNPDERKQSREVDKK